MPSNKVDIHFYTNHLSRTSLSLYPQHRPRLNCVHDADCIHFFLVVNVKLSKSHVTPPFLLNNTKLVLIFIRTVISCRFLELFVTNWLLPPQLFRSLRVLNTSRMPCIRSRIRVCKPFHVLYVLTRSVPLSSARRFRLLSTSCRISLSPMRLDVRPRMRFEHRTSESIDRSCNPATYDQLCRFQNQVQKRTRIVFPF